MKHTEEQKNRIIEALWASSHKKLFNFMGRWPMSLEEREDIVQEAFIRAYKSLDSFKGNCKLETWLFTIARNIYLNNIRYNHVQKRDWAGFDVRAFFELQSQSAQAGRVTDPILKSELDRIVDSVIVFKLKSRPQWIEVMREIFINLTDMSHAELAEAYGVEAAAMRREKHKLGKRIQEKLRALKAI